MNIVPVATALRVDDPAVPLARYAQIIGMPEDQFWGVYNPATYNNQECDAIWSKEERDLLLKYLSEAQYEIEQVVRYPLAPQWIEEESLPYSFPVHSLWRKVIEAGVRAEDDISLGEAVDHTGDPAVIGPVAVTFTDTEEVRVYHPGTDVLIYPSAIEIAGGFLTIDIPRSRMVLAALADTPAGGLDYTDTLLFEQTVDVTRVYNDPSEHAVLVYPHRCSDVCASAGCSEYTRTACIYVRDRELGWLDVLPGTYVSGAWTSSVVDICCAGVPSRVRVNYRAGLEEMTYQAEDAIVRLAHSKMPKEPCGCDLLMSVWRRDRAIPENVTEGMAECPFGMSEGAWVAWQYTQAMRQGWSATL